MKICTDLRAAIRSAHKAQKVDGTKRREIRDKALVDFLKRPAITKKIQEALRYRNEASTLSAKASAITESLGLSSCGYWIRDDAKFVNAGGKLPAGDNKPWSFDAVMAELARVSEKDGKAILKRIGINWQ